MKTYTLEEAAKITLPVLFDEAQSDEVVYIVHDGKSVRLWPLTPPGEPVTDDPYTEEELAVFRAFEAESARCLELSARETLAE